MNKIVLLNVRDLPTDEEMKPMRDYGIFLIASRISEEKMDSQSDKDNDGFKYRMKVERIESLMDLQEKKNIKFGKGQSPSQLQRWRIEEIIGRAGYENFMKYLLPKIDFLCEEFLNKYETKNNPITN